MRGSGLRIGRIFGIPIYVHATWLVIFALLTLSLEAKYGDASSHLTPIQKWAAVIATSILFFASVVFHELAHSVVAQRYKIKVVSITLFIFGGVARIARDPARAIEEFNIAVAGPLASYFLSGVFYLLSLASGKDTIVYDLAGWLGLINLYLATFNLLPGFPLDGGRIFRAIVWGATKNYSRATRIAGGVGKLVAYGMIVLGVWDAVIGRNWQNGLWLAFIGWFVLNAAQESVAQLAIRETLNGLSAADVMSHEVPTTSGSISLADYSADVLKTGRRCHLVVSDDRLVGLMTVYSLNAVPREEWLNTSVQAAMIPRERILWASPEEPLMRVLERLLAADVNQMPVVSGSGDGAAQIIGMVSRDSILRVMQSRSELGLPSESR